MITNGEKWHYLAVKLLLTLLLGTASKNNGEYYCISCLHSFRTKNKLKSHGKVCRIFDYFDVKMPKEYNKILIYNHGQKYIKIRYVIYADTNSLLEKINTCDNNKEKSSPIKINKHTACSFLKLTHLTVKKANKITTEVKTLLKKFCSNLRV